MQFIESRAVQNNILTDAERAAIINETLSEHPSTEHAEIVEGGVMLFDSYAEYCTWAYQATT